jgi:hypothetical protein
MPPLPNTRAIPRGLPEHFARTVLGAMTARVRCRPPDQVASRNTATGKTTFTASTAYYDGPAGVRAQGGSGIAPASAADRAIASAGWLVCVPHTVVQAVAGHLIEVYESDDDPLLVGLVLEVVDVHGGSILLERALRCDRHQGITPAT